MGVIAWFLPKRVLTHRIIYPSGAYLTKILHVFLQGPNDNQTFIFDDIKKSVKELLKRHVKDLFKQSRIDFALRTIWRKLK